MGRRDPAPAIDREYTDEDMDAEVLVELHNTVTFERGLGDVGNRIQLVEHECPTCSHDRMVRDIRVSPEESDYVAYWCQNPNCSHHVERRFSYTGRRKATEATLTDWE